MPTACRQGLAAFTTAVLLGAAAAAAAQMEAGAARRMVELDWARQDAVRVASAAGKAGAVKPEEDAAGGVDGVINGKWGFHTDNETNPWWQVDLGEIKALGLVRLYNREELAARNARLRLLLSTDGREFQMVFANSGLVFKGHSDGKPLEISLTNAEARFVRLALEGKSYLHLDEVQVFAPGFTNNLALGRPATQSSVSQWSVRHEPPAAAAPANYPLAQVIERGLRLAEGLSKLGVRGESEVESLKQTAAQWRQLPPGADAEQRRELYLRARWNVRRLALKNPLLNFERLLFVKRAPPILPHLSDQHYGWWSRPGGGLFVLEGFREDRPRLRQLTESFAAGSFGSPDVSFDGKRIVFSYCRHYPDLAGREKVDKGQLPEDSFYKIFEMNADGSGLRQLTFGRYDDFDPRYLPNGEIVFLSTRKGTALQCSQSSAEATRRETLPDSYVRCGGDTRRPVAVFTLHGMDANGGNLRPLSAFENFEWTPAVAADGRLLYTRWDYIDRFNGHFFSLWSANQDGTNPQLVYGNYTKAPQAVLEARSVPGSSRLVFTAAAHHSNTGGSICLLDRDRGAEGEAPLTRITPELPFPETEAWGNHFYAHPWPLSEEFFLVSWADHRLPPHAGSQPISDGRNPVNGMGLYLLDAFGNLELLCRDPDLSSHYPMPLAPRPRPAAQASLVDWDGPPAGRFLVQDIYQGLPGTPNGSIKQIRLVAVPPKVQPFMNQPMLGVSSEDPGKYVLGHAPVEADGSAYFWAPSGVPVFFQALDAEGVAVQTMRTLTYLMPGQTLACVGCHESRDTAPSPRGPVLAVRREPTRLATGPEGSWPLRFDRLVQPVLDRLCVACHHPAATNAVAAKTDLRPDQAYAALLSFANGDLKRKAFERDRSWPGEGVCATSKLWELLTAPTGHQGVRLDAEARERLALWMDTYAHRQGHFSEQQESELAVLRARLAPWLAERGR